MAPMTAAFIADIGHFAAARGLDHRLQASLWVRVIKASDFTDYAGVILTTGPKALLARQEYSPLVPALRELILRPDNPLDTDVKNMIVGQLNIVEGRFVAIWHGHDHDAEPDQQAAAQPT